MAAADPEPPPSADILWETNSHTLVAGTQVFVPADFADRSDCELYEFHAVADDGSGGGEGAIWGCGPTSVAIWASETAHTMTLTLSYQGSLLDSATYPVVGIDRAESVIAPADLDAVMSDPEYVDLQTTHPVMSTRGGTSVDQPITVTWTALGIPTTAEYAVYNASGVRVRRGQGVASKAIVKWNGLTDAGTLVLDGEYTLVIVAHPQRGFAVPTIVHATIETPVAPSPPTSVSARAGVNSAKVTWQPPTDDGGAALTAYTATATPGGQTCTTSGSGRSCYVTGLANGQPYSFAVVATNPGGTSEPASTGTVTPSVDTTAPVLGSTSVTPNRVPSTGGNIVVDVAASDDISGLKTGVNVAVLFEKAGGSSTFGFTTSFTRISGDEYDGVYRATISMPNGTPPGSWDLVVYPIKDAAGNNSSGFIHRPGVLVGAAAAPTDVVATVQEGRQVQVTWTPPVSNGGNVITGYKVTDSFTNITSTVTDPVFTAAYPTIPDDTALSFTVVAVNAAGDGLPGVSAPITVPATAPSAPASALATPGSQQAVVSWSAPASTGGTAITGYTVTATPGGQSCTGDADATSCTLTGLTNGTSYTVAVVASNSAGDSPAKVTDSILVAGLPDQVASVTAIAGDANVSLSWTVPANNGSAIIGYRIDEVNGAVPPVNVAGSVTSLVRTGLTNGQTYRFTVSARNGAGYGPGSEATAQMTPLGPPKQVTGVKAIRGDHRVTVSWLDAFPNGTPVTGYTVRLSPGGNVVQLPATARSLALGGLTNGVTYTAVVTATNAVGTSPDSLGARAVPAGLPSRVAKPRVAVRGHTVTVTWIAAFANGSPITRYKITGVRATAKVTSASTRRIVFRNVKPGVHRIRVGALNGVGWGPASVIGRITVRR